eukprot:scaffold874_cov126-Cylindrotheca_fusiformis.AAC.18
MSPKKHLVFPRAYVGGMELLRLRKRSFNLFHATFNNDDSDRAHRTLDCEESQFHVERPRQSPDVLCF